MGSSELVKNNLLCNESAWVIFVSILNTEVNDFPARYRCGEIILQAAFDLRRNAFLGIITHGEASTGLISLVQELPEELQDFLTEPEGPLVYIRDFFTNPKAIKGSRRHH